MCICPSERKTTMTSHNHSGLVRAQMGDKTNTYMEESATVWTDMLGAVWQSTCCLGLVFSSLHYCMACSLALIRYCAMVHCTSPGGSVQRQVLPHMKINGEVFKRGLQSVLKALLLAPNRPLSLNKLSKQ